MIRYVVGDATEPKGLGVKIIAHICNDRGGWGKGFVLRLSKKWPKAEEEYRAWYRELSVGTARSWLGEVQLVQIEATLYIANMIAQRGYASKRVSRPLSYDALRTCLVALRDGAMGMWETGVGAPSIHMPRIGTGLAGGKWSEIEPILEEELAGLTVVVYDLPSKFGA